ncbi:hypothetical protein AVEN_129184-1 [Araneus ventricosus]|uniref:Secreted protein n=1 Tax=Araneus ventricosus TaxID=182803 RepID=A0A4Y2X345_ARAVE|nr:hypothetical protein AVEN_129184-1 [Araneus ventricosus]
MCVVIFFLKRIVLLVSLRISFLVTALSHFPSKCNASDSSSAGISLPNPSKTVEYCSGGMISSRFVIALLGYGERFMHFEARSDRTD